MLLRHHESTQDLEQKHLRSIQELRDIHLKKQHHTERENQKEYNTKAEQDLRKKHALEQKQQPRSLRVCYKTLDKILFFFFFQPKHYFFVFWNICCIYSLGAPEGGAFNEYTQNTFSPVNQKKKIIWIALYFEFEFWLGVLESWQFVEVLWQ